MEVCNAGMIIFLVILCSAAWQDFKTRSVGCPFLMISGYLGGVYSVLAERRAQDIILSCAIGVLLLGIGKLTRGGIGEGDGWFFVVTGLFFDVGENLSLFLSGLSGCFLVSLPVAVVGVWKKNGNRKRGLPFLLFLLPKGILMAAEHVNFRLVNGI